MGSPRCRPPRGLRSISRHQPETRLRIPSTIRGLDAIRLASPGGRPHSSHAARRSFVRAASSGPIASRSARHRTNQAASWRALRPDPGLVHGVGDDKLPADLGAEVGDPTGDGAGLEADQPETLGLKESAESRRVGVDGGDAGGGGRGVVGSGDALGLAEVEADDGAHPRGSVGRVSRRCHTSRIPALRGPRGLHGFFRRRGPFGAERATASIRTRISGSDRTT